MTRDDDVLLSIVVRMVGEDTALERCLEALVPQTEGRQAEVIVPYDSTANGIERLRRKFLRVSFLDMGVIRTDARPITGGAAHEIYDRRTSAGLLAARGRIIAIIEDYGAPDPNWCEEVLLAHRLPHGVIGGAVEHAGTGILNWAAYFLDFGRYQLPLREGPSAYLTDANVSYKRVALESVRDLWAERYNEASVHWALARQGIVLWRRPQIVVRQDRGSLSFGHLVRQRFSWGRLFGYVRTREMSPISRAFYIVSSPGIPIVLLARMTAKIVRDERNRTPFLVALPLIVAITVFWWLGEVVGYVTGRQSS